MKSYKIGIIGLGYVGFPLACLFAKKYPTVGYDPYQQRVARLSEGVDVTNEISTEVIQARLSTHLRCTANPDELRDCNVYIVAVPTPIDLYQQPDLTALREASSTVGSLLKQGDIVIYESTVYPGVTEEVCVPILEQTSGLTFNIDFYVGYSPERINPGDKQHTVENICKITSGSTPEIASEIDALYNSVLTGGTYLASSIKVAEAAKVIEKVRTMRKEKNIPFKTPLKLYFITSEFPIREEMKNKMFEVIKKLCNMDKIEDFISEGAKERFENSSDNTKTEKLYDTLESLKGIVPFTVGNVSCYVPTKGAVNLEEELND